MLTKRSFIPAILLVCHTVYAQGSNIESMMSPTLRQFVATHPGASMSLSNVLWEAFSNRTVQLYYFYRDDESVARASHYYPTKYSVVIGVRENQEPTDQYLCLIYEILNSEGEKQYNELEGKVASGTISRDDFTKEVMRQEYHAALRVKKLLPSVKFSEQEIARSDYYKMETECPDTFEGFLKYSRKTVKYYEGMYDSLCSTRRPNNALERTANAP